VGKGKGLQKGDNGLTEPSFLLLLLLLLLLLQAHSCFKKACLVLGLEHGRILPASKDHDWALQPDTLQKAIEEDLAAGLIPFYALATVGTTSSCAVDPLPEIAAVTQK
jgi:glutamate/tyrosine decarboxylase-like PLP-dependent enzyme